MKRMIAALAFAAGLMFGGVSLFNETPAFSSDANIHLESKCGNVSTWYDNPDEGDRNPDTSENGLTFKNTDLIHHATDVALADLKPGTFSASPAPDQNSFFSVEISDPDGAYGTLRWNTDTSMWDLTTNLDQFHKASPDDYIGTDTKWGKITDKTRVFSFGPGYTANPAGTVTTVVKSVTFKGETYDLTCKPVVSSSSASPSPSKSHSASPSASHGGVVSHSSSSSSTGGALAITGSSTGPIVGGAIALLVAGVGALFLVRRRKVKFSA